jgi:hypothetical protein
MGTAIFSGVVWLVVVSLLHLDVVDLSYMCYVCFYSMCGCLVFCLMWFIWFNFGYGHVGPSLIVNLDVQSYMCLDDDAYYRLQGSSFDDAEPCKRMCSNCVCVFNHGFVKYVHNMFTKLS